MGSGGVLTPLFFIGATSGNALSSLLRLDRATLSAIGLVSVLAGASNTPISASIMAIELFGASIAPYAAISCIGSFLITGHRSIYPSQILGIKKSASIQTEIGKEVEEVSVNLYKREGSLISAISRIYSYLRKRK